MKSLSMIAWSALVLTACAAHAQVQVFQPPYPASSDDAANHAPANSYRAMPRGTIDNGPTAMSAPPMSESYGTNCAWDAAAPSGAFFGGVGVSWLTPVWQRNPAVARGNIQNGVNFVGTSDYTWDMRTAPSAFIGYRTADGLGVRGRWWEFNQNSAMNYAAGNDILVTSRPLNLGLIAPNGGGIFAESGLEISVFDLELTHDLRVDGWTMTIGLGGRYAHMHQEHNTYATTGAGTLAGSILSAHNFNGGGPTLSIGARHTIFGDLVFYGVARTSMLFGPAKQLAFQGDATGALLGWRQQSVTGLMPVLEMETGLEYGMQMGRGRLFVQGGFQGQVWFGAGSASRSTGLDTFDQTDSNLGLVGFTVRTGVQY